MPAGGLREGLRSRRAGVRDDPVGREPHQRVEQRGKGEDAARAAGIRSQGARDGVLPGDGGHGFLWVLVRFGKG